MFCTRVLRALKKVRRVVSCDTTRVVCAYRAMRALVAPGPSV